MKNLLVFACLLLMGVGCSSDHDQPIGDPSISPIAINDRNDKPFVPRSVEGVTIYNGSFLNMDRVFNPFQKHYQLIREQGAWNSFVDNVNYDSQPIDVQLDLEFYDVLAVIDVQYPNGGHSIDIVEIIEHEIDVKVFIDRLFRGDETHVVTNPIHLVKIPKLGKPVVFEEL